MFSLDFFLDQVMLKFAAPVKYFCVRYLSFSSKLFPVSIKKSSLCLAATARCAL